MDNQSPPPIGQNSNPPNQKQSLGSIELDHSNPDSIYQWLTLQITSPVFRNVIKDFIDENCSTFLDIEENTFEQGQLFNEFTMLVENLLNDVLELGQLTSEMFAEASQRGLEDEKYKKYYNQLINFSDYNYFKKLMTKRNYQLIKAAEEQIELSKLQRSQVSNQQNPQYIQNPNPQENDPNKLPPEMIQQLSQQEQDDLQRAIQESMAAEDQKRRIAAIEEEELRRALKQNMMESLKEKKKIEEQNRLKKQKEIDEDNKKKEEELLKEKEKHKKNIDEIKKEQEKMEREKQLLQQRIKDQENQRQKENEERKQRELKEKQQREKEQKEKQQREKDRELREQKEKEQREQKERELREQRERERELREQKAREDREQRERELREQREREQREIEKAKELKQKEKMNEDNFNIKNPYQRPPPVKENIEQKQTNIQNTIFLLQTK